MKLPSASMLDKLVIALRAEGLHGWITANSGNKTAEQQNACQRDAKELATVEICCGSNLRLVCCNFIQRIQPSKAAPSLEGILSGSSGRMQAAFARTEHHQARDLWLQSQRSQRRPPPRVTKDGLALAQAVARGDFEVPRRAGEGCGACTHALQQQIRRHCLTTASRRRAEGV